MDELERSHRELRDDINQLKEQVAKVFELLEKRGADGNSSGVNHEQSVTLDPPGSASVPTQSHGLSPQGAIVPLTVHPTYPPHLLITNPQGIQWLPYSLPPGYTPSQTTNPPSHNPPMSTSNPQDPINLPKHDQASNGTPQTQPPFPIFLSYPFSPSYIPPHNINSRNDDQSFLIPNPTPLNSHQPQTLHLDAREGPSAPHPVFMTTWQPQDSSPKHFQSQDELHILEERLRAIERADHYSLGDACELCLVPGVMIPPKFKVPDFEKYNGTTCPKSHLTMYCRKMASHSHDEKMLIHFFQDSLTGAALSWYMHLQRSRIRCWQDLTYAFLQQYKYNIDMAPGRLQLQDMSQKKVETFKEYAQRWREIAAQVVPPLSEKEMVTMFINTLQSPFYDKMIGSVSSSFADLVIIGERMECGIRSGKIAYNPAEELDTMKPFVNEGQKEKGSPVSHSTTSSTPSP